MKRLDVIKCLIISPQDVQAERAAIANVLERWNGQIGPSLESLIHAVRWETHSTPELGSPPQTILNRQIVKDCDCAIAVFWSRLGTPTEKADSGSMEEISEIIETGGHVLVYVCKRDIPQVMMDADQIKRLNDALDNLRQKGIVSEYSSIEQLQMLLMGHLTRVADMLLSANRAVLGEARTDEAESKKDSSVPEIRVKSSWALTIGPEPISLLLAEVQNHSSQPFYFRSISIELSDRRTLNPLVDAFKRPIQGHSKIEPGASLSFHFDFAEMLESINKYDGVRLRRFVVTDQIDRKFFSSEEDMEIAISNYRKWTEA